MATRTFVTTLSDLSEADDAASVSFGLDGTSYEIDLTAAEHAELRAALAPYVDAARRLTSTGRPITRIELDPAPQVIRGWAQRAGVECPAQGRIPESVLEQYRAAH